MTTPNSSMDFFETFKEFLHDIDPLTDTSEYLKTFEEWTELSEEEQNKIIKDVIYVLRSHSREILLRDKEMFKKELYIFKDLDVSNLYYTVGSDQQALFDYIERLYVFGTIHIRPKDKTRFLQLVKKLKDQYKTANTPLQAENNEQQLDEAMKRVQDMFGIQEGDMLGDMMKNIGQKVQNIMSDNTIDPQQVMMKMMSGDMSMFQDVLEDSSKTLNEQIENGDIDREEFEQRANQMMNQFNHLLPQPSQNIDDKQ